MDDFKTVGAPVIAVAVAWAVIVVAGYSQEMTEDHIHNTVAHIQYGVAKEVR